MKTDEVKDLLERSWDVLSRARDPKMLPAMRFLHTHLETPRSYVAFVGETSSGKSTLVNALLNRRFLPAGPRPTTGTVTWIEHGISDEEKLYAINRDASIEPITKSMFDEFAKTPDDNLLRLKADLPSSREGFNGLTIFDTPGFNSVIEQHEEVLKEFLPESDIILFTVLYRNGFGMEDQQMMSLIADIDQKFGERPVFLVVNRVPEGVNEHDGRIMEIRQHAEDTLHRKVRLVLVNSAMPDAAGNSTLPNAEKMWRSVAEIAFSPERQVELANRSRDILESLLEERRLELLNTLQAIDAGMASIPELENQIREFKKTEKESYDLIMEYVSKWSRQIPAKIKDAEGRLLLQINENIDGSSKWSDKESCTNFVYGHLIPFGVKQICKEIEEYLYWQVEELDAKLSEMASLAIEKMNNHVQTIEAPEVKKLMENLTLKLGNKLLGETASSIAKSVGGVGGAAAGTGNLVKMVVKRIGKLFGKTFSREVYKQIGKIFTKRMLAALGVAVDVVFEALSYIHESNTWQEKLKEHVAKSLENWNVEVQSEFSSRMIPEYKNANMDSVRSCYEELIQEIRNDIATCRNAHSQDEIRGLQAQLEFVMSMLLKLREGK